MADTLDLDPALARRLEGLGREFLVSILEREVERNAHNVDALAELGHLYTREGRHEDGLRVDRTLVRLLPHDATARYNLACSLALTARIDDALDELELSVELGYRDASFLEGDSDLDALRGEERFRRLVERLTASA